MEIPANAQISSDTVRVLASWTPGTFRVDDDGVAFVPHHGEAIVASFDRLARARVTTHLLGADDIVLELRDGGAWSLKVSDGGGALDELRRRGVTIG